jgi:hypothetical protein
MIRVIAPVREPAQDDPRAPRWLSIEGDDLHGYLVRAFADLDQRQLHDDWVESIESALEFGETHGVARSAWRPRSEPLPGGLPFPDVGHWEPDNSVFEVR